MRVGRGKEVERLPIIDRRLAEVCTLKDFVADRGESSSMNSYEGEPPNVNWYAIPIEISSDFSLKSHFKDFSGSQTGFLVDGKCHQTRFTRIGHACYESHTITENLFLPVCQEGHAVSDLGRLFVAYSFVGQSHVSQIDFA
ncbi:hypothetical protein WN51_08979 [Melipona quadrifasciata]|uniref:Uncharacterized protein n=1 Tax=Melipona quadrifasciata TaxID=166423 RepID=A0A0M9A9N3_9HYME|nr:hypothetical protein WN51_08979 [Melipona quadrifasciata]